MFCKSYTGKLLIYTASNTKNDGKIWENDGKIWVLGGSWRGPGALFLLYFHILKALAPPYYIPGRPGPAPAYYKGFPVVEYGNVHKTVKNQSFDESTT